MLVAGVIWGTVIGAFADTGDDGILGGGDSYGDDRISHDRLSPSELLDLYLFGDQSSGIGFESEDRDDRKRDEARRREEDAEDRREDALKRKWLENFKKDGPGEFSHERARRDRGDGRDDRDDHDRGDRRDDDIGDDGKRVRSDRDSDGKADDRSKDDLSDLTPADEAGDDTSSDIAGADKSDLDADERKKKERETWKDLTAPIRGRFHDWVPDRVNRLHNGAFEKEPDNGFPVPYRLNGHLDIQRKLPWEEEID